MFQEDDFMKLRYLLCTLPTLSMAADAPVNFADAFHALSLELNREAMQAAEAPKTSEFQSKADKIFINEFVGRDTLKTEEEEKLQKIIGYCSASHAVLSLPSEYIKNARNNIIEEAAARKDLEDQFKKQKQIVQKKLDDMPMQSVVLCNGITLTIRQSVLNEIPFIEKLIGFNNPKDFVDEKIILGENINPMLFCRLVNYLTHRQSGAQIEAPDLFKIQGWSFLNLLNNQKFLVFLDYMRLETLDAELKIMAKYANFSMIFSCAQTIQLAQIPNTVWRAILGDVDTGNMHKIRVNFSDNLPYLSSSLNESIQALSENGMQVTAFIKNDYATSRSSGIIAMIEHFLSTTLIPTRVMINTLDSCTVSPLVDDSSNVSMMLLKEKVQSMTLMNNELQEKIVFILDELIKKATKTVRYYS